MSAVLHLFLWLVCSSREESSGYCLRSMCLAATVLGVRQGKMGWVGVLKCLVYQHFTFPCFTLYSFSSPYIPVSVNSFLLQIFPENKATYVLPGLKKRNKTWFLLLCVSFTFTQNPSLLTFLVNNGYGFFPYQGIFSDTSCVSYNLTQF